MRISDWSSDVCSSDLTGRWSGRRRLCQRNPRHSGRGVQRNIRRAEQRLWHRNGPAGPQPSLLERPLFRSEEHTSELQSLMRISYAVFCLKKKKEVNVQITVTKQHKR